MSQLKVTHPDVKKAQDKKRKEIAPKHDGLHGKYETCYCLNKCCWYSWIHVRESGEKVQLGICICSSCPCETPRISGIRSGL